MIHSAKKTKEAFNSFGANLKSATALAADRTTTAFQSLKPKAKEGAASGDISFVKFF